MEDINGSKLEVNDWIQGLGYYPYGKVAKVTDDELLYVDDEGDHTITKEDIKNLSIAMAPYSNVRKRFLSGIIPDDYLTLSTAQENAKLPQYEGISFFEALVSEIIEEIPQVTGKVYLEKVDGYLDKVKATLKNCEDEELFIEEMQNWFKENL